MGNWYTNICVNGPQQSQVVAVLDELGRRAYVTPEMKGWIIVYDQETDKFDLNELESLALTISTRLSWAALASFNADDDVLWLGIYENGKLSARYASEKRDFEDGGELPLIPEVTEVLCRIFARPEKNQQVRRILRRRHGVLGFFSAFSKIRLAYLIEVLRHSDLAEALGIPGASVGFGYEYIHRGETPEGLSRGDLQKTLSG
ncbi:MAG: hypothetical protein DMG35_17855 [Acidobacteria bacterium]|nr:MAG: hypothetical protein AUH86_01030 [Acidobacteria bacterium 13_1_40CM_4_58_4]PYT58411.1 MAG: hypothetical protein DMG35_17855 [Acidobacteriota bacterium]